MTTRTIPARTVIRCDRCHEEGEFRKPGAFVDRHTHFSAESSYVSHMGDEGGGTWHYDLCSRCANNFDDWMTKP